jgi:primase-polymerase (primpol)-like protein
LISEDKDNNTENQSVNNSISSKIYKDSGISVDESEPVQQEEVKQEKSKDDIFIEKLAAKYNTTYDIVNNLLKNIKKPNILNYDIFIRNIERDLKDCEINKSIIADIEKYINPSESIIKTPEFEDPELVDEISKWMDEELEKLGINYNTFDDSIARKNFLENVKNIPEEMKKEKSWVVRKGKLPFQTNGHPADSTNPETWNTFIQCMSIVSEFDGIGFVFSEDSEIMGVDFDHIYENGVWDTEALEEILSLNSYAEMSPSGSGVHVYVKANIEKALKCGGREMYAKQRYFTVTGNHLENTPYEINQAQEAVNELYNKWINEKENKNIKSETAPNQSPKQSPKMTDREIIELAGKAKNANKFKALYAGNWEELGYPSQSEADLAFCSILAFYTQDAAQIDTIFESSGLFRDKWKREDYKDRVISEALNSVTTHYTKAPKINLDTNTVKIELPEFDFYFEIEYNKKDKIYNINIPNYNIPKQFTPKKFFDVANNSRNKELIEFITTYGNQNEKQSKEIIEEFNKACGLDNNYKKLKLLMAQSEAEEKTESKPYETDEIMQKVEEILKTGNPHDFMMDVFQTIHIGDKIAFSAIFLAIMNQSIKNSKGLQVSFNGDSSDGKSHAVKSTKRLIPKDQIIDASLSGKALFYQNLKAGTIIYSDDTEIPDDLENTLKRSMTNFQEETEHLTVDGNKEGKRLFIPKRMVYLFTSVDEKGGQELQNRKIQITIEDSRAHKYSIVQNQVQNVMNGYDPYLNEPTEDMLICQAMFSIFHKQDFGVAIPFADRIEGYDIKNVRNNDKFYNMIMGFTLSKYMQRERDVNNNLIATEEDFEAAANIYNKIYKNVTTNLTDAELKMCKIISSFGYQGATSKELQKELDISQTMVSRRLQSIETKLSSLLIDDGSESEGTYDGNGNTSSSSKKIKRYYLSNFNENNLNKAVYLVEKKIDFNALIKNAKKEEIQQKAEERQKEKQKREETQRPKLVLCLNDDNSVTA